MGVGPSTKETSKFRFHDPLLKIMSEDQDLNLMGIIIQGTPQSEAEKVFCATRSAIVARAMNVDGAVVSIDGWGNSNIDFVSLLDALNDRGIPTSGLSFVGTAGKFVVESPNLKGVIDINKSKDGVETCVLGENSMDELDARKAVAVLKLKMRKEK